MGKAKILQTKQVEHVTNERRLLSIIRHPFIVQYYGSFQDTRNVYLGAYTADECGFLCFATFTYGLEWGSLLWRFLLTAPPRLAFVSAFDFVEMVFERSRETEQTGWIRIN